MRIPTRHTASFRYLLLGICWRLTWRSASSARLWRNRRCIPRANRCVMRREWDRGAAADLRLQTSRALAHGEHGAVHGLAVSHSAGPLGLEKRILQTSLARHWARDWRALALTQVHHGSRRSDSCEDGEALSSVHSTALAAGKLIHNLQKQNSAKKEFPN